MAQSGGPKLKSTCTGDLHVKGHLNPKNPNTKLVVSTTSDLSVSPCFGVVYGITRLATKYPRRYFKGDLRCPKGCFKKDSRGHESRVSTGALLHCCAPHSQDYSEPQHQGSSVPSSSLPQQAKDSWRARLSGGSLETGFEISCLMWIFVSLGLFSLCTA